MVDDVSYHGKRTNPPSASISEKYNAPLRPQGRAETSTSKVNSWFNGLNIWYSVSLPGAIRYTREPTFV